MQFPIVSLKCFYLGEDFLPGKNERHFSSLQTQQQLPTNQPTQPNPTHPNPTQPNPTQRNQPIPSINEVPIWFTSSPFQSRNNICQTVKPGSTSKESRGWGSGWGWGCPKGGQMSLKKCRVLCRWYFSRGFWFCTFFQRANKSNFVWKKLCIFFSISCFLCLFFRDIFFVTSGNSHLPHRTVGL